MSEAIVGEQQRRTSLFASSRWNLVAFACALLPNFIIVPFAVKEIGLAAFGQAGLVLAICAPMVLLGTVLGQSLVREMSTRLADGDEDGARRTVDAALGLCLLGSIVGWVFLVVVGPAIANAVTGGQESLSRARLAFVIAATGWFLQQVILVLQATSAARQDFRTIAGVAAFTGVATIATTIGITIAVPSVEGYLAGVTAGTATSAFGWWWAARTEVRWSGVLLAKRTTEARAVLRFARWQSLALVAGALSNQIDRYMLGAATTVTAQYNVAQRVQEAAYIGAIRSGEVLFPRFGSLSSRSTADRTQLFQTTSWIVGTFSAMLLVPLVPLSDAIVATWVPQAGPGAAILLRTLALGGVIACGSNVFVYYAMGIGRNASAALTTVVYSIVAVILTVFFIRTLGPYAAGGGLLFASVVRVAAALLVTHRDFFPGMSWVALSVSTVLPVASGVIVAAIASLAGLSRVNGWLELSISYIAVSGCVLVSTLLLSSLSVSGRTMVRTVASAVRTQVPLG